MTLPSKQIIELRSKAHHLKPVVLLGDKGLTPNVIAEIKQALYDHELIKVKAKGEKETEKSESTSVADTICQETGAELVQMIGHILILYKKSEKHAKN